MKQVNEAGEQPRVAVYVRVGRIQQLFRSNAEMVRHLFMELLEDGKEHSAKEIIEYIFDKTRGYGVKDGRLTENAIDSAIRAMFRHGQGTGYRQAHKGFYQKSIAEMADGRTRALG